jgi:hypothetical protein
MREILLSSSQGGEIISENYAVAIYREIRAHFSCFFINGESLTNGELELNRYGYRRFRSRQITERGQKKQARFR